MGGNVECIQFPPLGCRLVCLHHAFVRISTGLCHAAMPRLTPFAYEGLRTREIRRVSALSSGITQEGGNSCSRISSREKHREGSDRIAIDDAELAGDELPL